MTHQKTIEEVFTYFDEREDKAIEAWLTERGHKWGHPVLCGSCCGFYDQAYWVRLTPSEIAEFNAYAISEGIEAHADSGGIRTGPPLERKDNQPVIAEDEIVDLPPGPPVPVAETADRKAVARATKEAFRSGGIVPKPTLAPIAEKGPEYIVPQAKIPAFIEHIKNFPQKPKKMRIKLIRGDDVPDKLWNELTGLADDNPTLADGHEHD